MKTRLLRRLRRDYRLVYSPAVTGLPALWRVDRRVQDIEGSSWWNVQDIYNSEQSAIAGWIHNTHGVMSAAISRMKSKKVLP